MVTPAQFICAVESQGVPQMKKNQSVVEDQLFPVLPEDLSEVSDEDLASLLREHEAAAQLIRKNDEDFTEGLTAEQIVEALKLGVARTATLREEIARREEGQAEFAKQLDELATSILGAEEAEEGGAGGDGTDGDEGDGGEEGQTLADDDGDEGDEGSDEEG